MKRESRRRPARRTTRRRRRPVARSRPVELPFSKRQLAFAALAAVLGIAAGVGLPRAWSRFVELPALGVREIEVSGVAHASPDAVLELAALATGDPWLALDTRGARFRVLSHPWVNEARIRRVGLGRVRIEIEECVPVATVRVKGQRYGICDDLRIVPGEDGAYARLPALQADLTPAALGRGVAYVTAMKERGMAGAETVELEIGRETDRISLPERGFSASVDEAIEPEQAVRNLESFLERLDGKGASRGTLRLISDGTAVWETA